MRTAVVLWKHTNSSCNVSSGTSFSRLERGVAARHFCGVLVRVAVVHGLPELNVFNALITTTCLAVNPSVCGKMSCFWWSVGSSGVSPFAYSITHNLVTAPCEAVSILTCMRPLELYMTACIIAATPAGLTGPDESKFFFPLFFSRLRIFLSFNENITGVMRIIPYNQSTAAAVNWMHFFFFLPHSV